MYEILGSAPDIYSYMYIYKHTQKEMKNHIGIQAGSHKTGARERILEIFSLQRENKGKEKWMRKANYVMLTFKDKVLTLRPYLPK